MRGKETPFAGLRCSDAHSRGESGCLQGWDGTTGPATPRTAAAARSLLPPTSPFDAVPAGPTGLNRQTGLFAEVTHLRRERVACFRVLFAISSRGCVRVRVRVWCHATGRSRRLKITTPSCARWRWNRHCAITPTSRRICTASFSDGAVGFFFPFFFLPAISVYFTEG